MKLTRLGLHNGEMVSMGQDGKVYNDAGDVIPAEEVKALIDPPSADQAPEPAEAPPETAATE